MKPSRQAPKVLPPSGLQKFRCIQVIDLGTQKKEYLGTVKYQKRVLLTFELVNTNHQFRDGEKEMPFVIKQEFTNSLSERGNLLPFLESWKGGLYKEMNLTTWICLSFASTGQVLQT